MKTQNTVNTVKYFTVKNCHKANLKPCEDSEILKYENRKVFTYKGCLAIFQRYTREKGATLSVKAIGSYHYEIRKESEILSDCCGYESKEGRDFYSTFNNVKEIDISLLQEKLDAIIKRAEMVKSGVLPEEEVTEFLERIHKEIEVRQEVLRGIVIPSNWVELYYYELVRLGERIGDIQKELRYFNDRLKEFSECTDIAQKTYVIGCMDWPSSYYRCDLLEQVLKLKALAEREQA